MQPVEFREQNAVFTHPDEDVKDLPALITNESITIVWELTEDDIDIILRTKRIAVEHFSQTLPPMRIGVIKK